MKTIALSQGFVALVDDEDFEALSRHRWFVLRSARSAYARRQAAVGGRRVHLLMHRIILDAPSGMLVDHRNRDGLDNRRSNLRLCSPTDNARNRGAIVGASRYKGVAWDKNRGRWQVRLWIGGRQRSMGCFDSEVDAALAYDEAVRRHHGEFAVTNFGPGGLYAVVAS